MGLVGRNASTSGHRMMFTSILNRPASLIDAGI
jgi:hypothetical protein